MMAAWWSPVLVFLGGGTGATLRWWVGTVVPAPWGTMLVNVLGSLLLAFFLHESTGLTAAWRLVLGTGMMGGFTTYSTFNHDVLQALSDGRHGHAAVVALGSLVLCLLGGMVGWWLAGVMGTTPR